MMMMPAVFDMINLLYYTRVAGQDRSTIKFAAAHEKVAMGIRAKIPALLIEHLRATNRTALPPVLRRLIVLVCWLQSIGESFHDANIATNECWRKALSSTSPVSIRRLLTPLGCRVANRAVLCSPHHHERRRSPMLDIAVSA
jgi:hypothetical protein